MKDPAIEQQKKVDAILATETYSTGQSFLTSEMRYVMGNAVGRKVDIQEASNTLNYMAKEGLLDFSITSKLKKRWYKPLAHKLSIPWRTKTNSQLGIVERHGLGWHGN